MTKLKLLPTLALLCAFAGCGTASNLRKDRAPFGGVTDTVQVGKSRLEHVGEGKCIPPIYDYTAAAYYFLIDVPLSAIGDTLSLPFTLAATLNRAD